jgi:hypothetical protein
MASAVNVGVTRISTANVRSRYAAIGAERVFFAVAAVATILGALLPLIQTPIMLFTAGSAMRFYNLGLDGWLLFVALCVLAGAPFARPMSSSGARAIPLLALSGAVLGVLVTLYAVSSYGFFNVQPGAVAWLVAAAAATAGYSRRIIIRPIRLDPGD